MRSINQLNQYPAGIQIMSEDIIEFHASRLLLLLYICGKKDRNSDFLKIEGFTKLVKLDFFIRYPAFFQRVAKNLGEEIPTSEKTIESKMIRYNYGPWDYRYYQVLPYLEARGLLIIEKSNKNNQYNFYLTQKGIELSKIIYSIPEFSKIKLHIIKVKDILNKKSGNELKEIIYRTFNKEVTEKELGETIDYDY